VLVVDCSVDEQISRVKKRDNITEDTLYTIIASQVSRDFRRHAADDLIDNTQASSPLKLQVQRLHTLYISLSTARI
jgi:dephospho-CoA kinase